jgi:hypothetical protein
MSILPFVLISPHLKTPTLSKEKKEKRKEKERKEESLSTLAHTSRMHK